MSSKKLLAILLSAYLVICAVIIYRSGFFSPASADKEHGIITLASEADSPTKAKVKTESSFSRPPETTPAPANFSIISAEKKDVILGSVVPEDQDNKFLIKLELTSRGAAIATAWLRDYNNRNRKNPEPMKIVYPVQDVPGSMVSGRLLLYDFGKALPLDELNWKFTGKQLTPDGAQKAVFRAVVSKNRKEALIITKTFTLLPESYILSCDIKIKNVTSEPFNTAMEIYGPSGIFREGTRADMRKVTAAFINRQGEISTVSSNIRKIEKQNGDRLELMPKDTAQGDFLWASITSKYFAAIVWPEPQNKDKLACDWIADKTGICYPGSAADKSDLNIGLLFRTTAAAVGPAQTQDYRFRVYLGPKDKRLFDKSALYSKLGFVQDITFRACFGNLFRPLSFFILDLMRWLHDTFWPHNYGIVIIIFVFIIRVLLHPITKKSQVSMMKMAKLGPMAEEIKKKYANNKAEQQKRMMTLYKEHGASPVLGCLPMFLQMPIWIALYSAIYVGIEFRGAEFLPFWITDLSSPDKLFALPAVVEHLPIIGNFIGTSFNLLPILLAAAMFAQQRLMPSSAAATTSSQAGQQQKMMMWLMPIMMLLFLYRAPSGLNLYIMSSTTAGVIEQYVIRKHIREKQAAEQIGKVPVTAKTGGKIKKKKPKPPFKF